MYLLIFKKVLKRVGNCSTGYVNSRNLQTQEWHKFTN